MQIDFVMSYMFKGLSELLYETSILLQQTDLSDSGKACALFERLNETASLFETNAERENKIIYPIIGQYSPDCKDKLSAGYRAELEHLKDFKSLVRSYEQVALTGCDATRHKMLKMAFSEFVVFHIRNINFKEELFNRVFIESTRDAEILRFNQQLQAAFLFAEEAAVFYKWMMRGLNEREIVLLLKAAEQDASGSVCLNLLYAAEKELPRNRWEKVQDAVAVGALLA